MFGVTQGMLGVVVQGPQLAGHGFTQTRSVSHVTGRQAASSAPSPQHSLAFSYLLELPFSGVL